MSIRPVYDLTLDQLSAKLEAIGSQVIPDVGVAVQEVATERLFMDIVRRAPKGSVLTSPHPGKLRASVRASIGRPSAAGLPDQLSYPTPGYLEVREVTKDLKLGDPTFITDDARSDGAEVAYSPIIEMGRHVDSLGRMAGSEQAPQGFFCPAIEQLQREAPAVLRKGMARSLQRNTI